MSAATATSVRRPSLPEGHTLQGKAFKGSFGKSSVVAAFTSAHGGDPRIRTYTVKGKGLKSVSREQSVAECAAKIALHDASPQPEPEPEPKRTTRKARKARKGASKKAQPSLGRGEAAAEASLEAAVATPRRARAPKLKDGEHHFAFYKRCKAAGLNQASASKAYRKQVKARK